MSANIFFTADTHFGHDGIIPSCRRPFKSTEEMDAVLIENWNKQVKPTDEVWHLGDFAWKNHLAYLKKLNGKINLILGNHDKMAAYARKEFAAVYDQYYGYVSSDEADGKFFLHHYPMVAWPYKAWGVKGGHDYGRGVAHLYGHVHGRYDRPGDPAIDVGVDCRKFTLFPLDQVVYLIWAKVTTSGHNSCHDDTKQPEIDD